MKRSKLLFSAALVLMTVAAAVLLWFRTHQKLGTPGIKAGPIPGSVVMKIDLPEIPEFTSTNLEQDKTTLDMLPKDTSFARRQYRSNDGHFQVVGNIILMGTDRTSIHKPEYCLPGQGYHFTKGEATIAIGGSEPYVLPVAKWLVSGMMPAEGGGTVDRHGVYVFWFVAENELTTSHWTRIGWLARDLLTTGVLQRWAYVSYYAPCYPGQEEATFERMKQLIAVSVPEFQVAPKSARAATVAAR